LPGYWPPALAREFSPRFDAPLPMAFRGISAALPNLLLRLPPALLAESAYGWPIDQEGAAGLVELLTFRHEALTALSQP
jgi:hypothetical protein